LGEHQEAMQQAQDEWEQSDEAEALYSLLTPEQKAEAEE